MPPGETQARAFEPAKLAATKPLSGKVALLAWLCLLAGLAGGTLWALSPLGVRLSEFAFRAPALFWKLFPSAPALMLFGLLGMYLYSRGGEDGGVLRKVGFAVALLGAVLTALGNIGLYHLGLDDTFIMSAPAWRTFRVGLFVFAAGVLFFAFVAGRDRSLPLLGVLPLVVGAFFGVVAVVRDLGQFGAGMWITFGVTFAWCSFVLVVLSLRAFLRSRRVTNAVDSG